MIVPPYFYKDQDGLIQLHFNGGTLPSKEHVQECISAMRLYLAETPGEYIEAYNEWWLENAERGEYPTLERKRKILENPRSGYLYLLEVSGRYKIGRALKPKDRIKKYITENPDAVIVHSCVRVDDYKTVEKEVLDTFKDYQLRGEWFEFPDKVLSGAKRLIESLSL